ncbi:SigE family RNA polymerase sigma factor [Actinosynnema sp. NPDC047251]|uniref:RNA polymerase, sigma-24 subunit, ECF subfamily n=1 Tax=Saccharothrix espanaensis (strain ATCC 51144 / DSM 44229 / JCM 9112 / NBRC 15066 / NRRL 15764) TaxID=1179773 RepID=K0K134_SACES|nr:SigE family RNA polymerase sigma factor [Saccharothrix espanaensis]CCH31262.1 RNA polymerase, sigma-24 subunit, ECF subfamily [Saccharothrix espanaensis DSM 44229]
MRRDDEFSRFFASRFDQARRTANALCGNWVEAEEIAQHAFVRLYAHWPRVRPDSADAYLRTVLTRVFLDSRRRGRRREEVVASPPEAAVPPDTAAAEERPPLLAALQRVPPRQRAVLVLRYVHDLSVEQVAEAMDCSPGTVKSQAARGLETLRTAYHGAAAPGGA